MNGIFVTGTDTDVGKTWVGSQLLAALKCRNIPVKVRKPVESGWPEEDQISTTDAWKLASAIDQTDHLDIICPNRYRAALSPDRAAMLEGDRLQLEKLKQDSLTGVKIDDFLYVEGAGGFFSPIAEDGLNADLAAILELPVLLVVENRLGCINQTLLNVEAITNRGLGLKAIALNSPRATDDDKRMDNLNDVQKRVTCEVIPFNFEQRSSCLVSKLATLVTDILK